MDESVIIVKEGRHLLQELTVEGAFVPNDTYINIDKNIALITGIGLNSILNPYGDLRERNHKYNDKISNNNCSNNNNNDNNDNKNNNSNNNNSSNNTIDEIFK